MPNRRSSLVAGRLLVAVGIGLACSIAAPLSCHAQVPRDGIEPPTPAASMRRSTPELSRQDGEFAYRPRLLAGRRGPHRDSAAPRIERGLPPLGHASNIAPNATNFKPDGTTVTPRLLAIPVAAVFGASVYAIHADREWHHEYIGAALLVSNRRWVQWVGLAVMADDAAQHLIQTRRPSYRSPLHKAYAVTLYRWTR